MTHSRKGTCAYLRSALNLWTCSVFNDPRELRMDRHRSDRNHRWAARFLRARSSLNIQYARNTNCSTSNLSVRGKCMASIQECTVEKYSTLRMPFSFIVYMYISPFLNKLSFLVEKCDRCVVAPALRWPLNSIKSAVVSTSVMARWEVESFSRREKSPSQPSREGYLDHKNAAIVSLHG